MSNIEGKKVTIIAEADHWAQACIKALQTSGINTVLQPPDINLLKEDRVKGGLFLVPVTGVDDTERFEIVERIGEYDGMSIVLAGRDAGLVAMRCWTLRRASGVKKNMDFPILEGFVRTVLSSEPI